MSPHETGAPWPGWVMSGPVWTFTYQPSAGMAKSPGTVLVAVPAPEASALSVCSDLSIGPAFAQEPLWMWLACWELAFMPIRVSLTVKEPEPFMITAVPVTPLPATACMVTEIPCGLGDAGSGLVVEVPGEPPPQATATTATSRRCSASRAGAL